MSVPTVLATREDILAELKALDDLLDKIGDDVEDERALNEVRVRQERVREELRAIRINGA